MPESRTCPHCGASMPNKAKPRAEGPSTGLPPEELDRPSVPLLAPGSHDDHNFFGLSSGSGTAILEAEPDPLLGPFVTPTSSPSASAVLGGVRLGRSGEAFPAIDLGPGSRSTPPRATPGNSASRSEDDFEPEGRRSSWVVLLLASYASALTLGLGWTLWKTRTREKPVPVASAEAAPPVESARQIGLSRKVAPPEPILGEHFAAMGKSLRLGDLEITPVEVKRLDVVLRRSGSFAGSGQKAGGKGALSLRLRLKNHSKDAVFAPLDQAYLRERGPEIVDTFVETAQGDRVYPFPLAVDSEWSIVGQDFAEMKPGESRTVAVVTAPDAPPDSSGPFTWRVRFRTGINRTDVVGLRWPER